MLEITSGGEHASEKYRANRILSQSAARGHHGLTHCQPGEVYAELSQRLPTVGGCYMDVGGRINHPYLQGCSPLVIHDVIFRPRSCLFVPTVSDVHQPAFYSEVYLVSHIPPI